MKETAECAFEERYAALEQDPDAGKLFLNMSIPAVGQVVDIDPDALTDDWEVLYFP